MSEHTVGPWKAVQQASCSAFWWVADAWGKKVCGLSHSVRDEDKKVVANLIAAAPDMLAACEAVLAEFDQWDDEEEEERNAGCVFRNKSVRAYRLVKEAAAKAKGE